jgi:hypothetical protein
MEAYKEKALEIKGFCRVVDVGGVYLVETAGVEPASVSPLPSALHA